MSLNPSDCSACEENKNQGQADQSTDPVVIAGPFVPPSLTTEKPALVIEFCTRCRWLHRATWTLTEVLLTFQPPTLASASLVPLDSTETNGRFRVWVVLPEETVLVWDRKTEGDFPVLKVLKQRIRDRIEPNRSLGHSDKS
ncbi:Rdx family-domain-containing protein [Hysterangium stoloniferum]|nr:Rdx family-domain-containing protein [Hysterangium stoloniferum]